MFGCSDSSGKADFLRGHFFIGADGVNTEKPAYFTKRNGEMACYQDHAFSIRDLQPDDIRPIVEGEIAQGWQSHMKSMR